jgi:feruloyl esterase
MPVFIFASLLLAAASASAAPRCEELAASIPIGDDLQSISSALVPAAGANAAYCRVDLKSLREINIRVGLPLSAGDGGTGGVQGAWNGKLRNLGGGGTVGSVGPVTTATNTGYVGSSTDGGHNNAVCAANGHPGCAPGGYGFVLDASNNLIWSQLEDFAYVSVIEQVRWAGRLAEAYYGTKASRNYWDGCSTGGRQGMEMAQRYGDLFDGILAGVPAMNFSRFVTGSLWIGTVLNDAFGTAGLANAKITAANNAAIAACDANDGVVDGIINEPRRCTFSARANVCGEPTAPATGCLTLQEADAVDKVWDGSRNRAGERLWGGPTRGTAWTILAAGSGGALNQPASIPFAHIRSVVEQDPDWSYTNLTAGNFDIEFQKADTKEARFAADNVNLDKLRSHGGKLLTWHGGSDPLILPYGSLEYWGRLFDNYGGPAKTEKFFRAFFFPGVGHCGGNAAPQPPDLFGILVNWVENGVAPDYLIGTQNLGGGTARTRKICKYPNEAVYNGTGSTDDQANFSCVAHKRVPADLKAYMQSAARFGQAGSAVPITTRIDWQLDVLAGVPQSEDFAEQLAGVREKVVAGKTKAACGQLRAYMNHVRAQVDPAHPGPARRSERHHRAPLEPLLADSMLAVGAGIQGDLACAKARRPHPK